jgi:hypothetical protein
MTDASFQSNDSSALNQKKDLDGSHAKKVAEKQASNSLSLEAMSHTLSSAAASITNIFGETRNAALDALSGVDSKKRLLSGITPALAQEYERGKHLESDGPKLAKLSNPDKQAIEVYRKIHDGAVTNIPLYDHETLIKQVESGIAEKANAPHPRAVPQEKDHLVLPKPEARVESLVKKEQPSVSSRETVPHKTNSSALENNKHVSDISKSDGKEQTGRQEKITTRQVAADHGISTTHGDGLRSEQTARDNFISRGEVASQKNRDIDHKLDLLFRDNQSLKRTLESPVHEATQTKALGRDVHVPILSSKEFIRLEPQVRLANGLRYISPREGVWEYCLNAARSMANRILREPERSFAEIKSINRYSIRENVWPVGQLPKDHSVHSLLKTKVSNEISSTGKTSVVFLSTGKIAYSHHHIESAKRTYGIAGSIGNRGQFIAGEHKVVAAKDKTPATYFARNANWRTVIDNVRNLKSMQQSNAFRNPTGVRALTERTVKLTPNDTKNIANNKEKSGPRIRSEISDNKTSEKRYIFGTELALAAIVAAAGASRVRPEQKPDQTTVDDQENQNKKNSAKENDVPKQKLPVTNRSENHLVDIPVENSDESKTAMDGTSLVTEDAGLLKLQDQDRRTFRRPTILVSVNDTLVSIAERFFNDAKIAWLIADLNASNTKESWVDGKRVVQLKSRQPLVLPISEDIELFYSRENRELKPSHLITIVEQSQIDLELLDYSLGPTIGRDHDSEP